MTITTDLFLPPQSVIGNPNAISAPAQAISFAELEIVLFGNLIKQTLPPQVDFDYLPPQTLIGNPTATTAELAFCTFAELIALNTQGVSTTYSNFDPTNVPPFTVIGNFSKSAKLAVPVPIGSLGLLFSHQPKLLNLFYFQNVFIYSVS